MGKFMNSLIKKIVVAVNGTKSSIIASQYAIILAKQYHLDAKFVFVVDTATIKYLANFKILAGEEKNEYKTNLTKDGKHYLEYVENLASTKGVQIETELKEGDVASEIINAADEYKADLIVIGGHEADGHYVESARSKKSLSWTVRNEIVQNAHCPVLVVHKKEFEKMFKVL